MLPLRYMVPIISLMNKGGHTMQNYDSGFISFLQKIKNVSNKITKNKILSVALIVILNNTVKVYQKEDGSSIELKRIYHSKYSQELIQYFEEKHISEGNEDYLPAGFELKPGSYIYWIYPSDAKKM